MRLNGGKISVTSSSKTESSIEKVEITKLATTIKSLVVATTRKISFMLAIVIKKEVAKTEASFLSCRVLDT